ncbi:hypothetical protein [Clostridium botulinum]|uniref:hypothetical protein n=1 Tax=Clostridium botulinum TaxID=1491 RepID=UPI000773F8C4|nr:hypothetical protein [Clostridium botulinum]
MDKIYKSFKCKFCRGEFILMNSDIDNNKLKGKYISCPYCGNKKIKGTKETDDLKECMNHATYKKIKGAFRQVHSG